MEYDKKEHSNIADSFGFGGVAICPDSDAA
jgi:hypothetical protein